MSMFTPRGQGARPLRRRGARSVAGRRVAVVAVTLLALVSLAFLAWQTTRDDEPTVRARPPKTCPTSTPLPTVVAPAKIKVNVYNATDQRGLATEVAGQLGRRGFTVGKVDNDPLERTVTGIAEVRHSETGDGAARTVAAQVGTVVSVPDQRANGSVDLVLGAEFDHLLTRAEAAAVLSPSPSPTPAGC